jgi:hypothetical protein
MKHIDEVDLHYMRLDLCASYDEWQEMLEHSIVEALIERIDVLIENANEMIY